MLWRLIGNANALGEQIAMLSGQPGAGPRGGVLGCPKGGVSACLSSVPGRRRRSVAQPARGASQPASLPLSSGSRSPCVLEATDSGVY